MSTTITLVHVTPTTKRQTRADRIWRLVGISVTVLAVGSIGYLFVRPQTEQEVKRRTSFEMGQVGAEDAFDRRFHGDREARAAFDKGLWATVDRLHAERAISERAKSEGMGHPDSTAFCYAEGKAYSDGYSLEGRTCMRDSSGRFVWYMPPPVPPALLPPGRPS